MNISAKPVTSVNLSLELTEAEARAILVDPAPFQSEIRATLKDAHRSDAQTGGGIKPSLNGKDGRKDGRRPKAPIVSPAKMNGNANHYERIPCSECGLPIARARMVRHLSTRHGILSPLASTHAPAAAS